MDLSRVQAVLLDMDGTLVDSDAAVERSWRTWAVEYPVDPGRGPLVAHGLPAVANVRRLRPDLSEDEAAAAAQHQLELEYDDVADVTAAPGAHELLAELDRLGLPWAVVTSADVPLARTRLDAAGIRPALLVTIDDVRHGKPDPEGYLLAARKLGVDPRRCLVVEDAEAGVSAGRAAGATVAALKGVPADIQIADLHELTSLLRAGRVTPRT
jgi:HAD superfamily hydrolase (TIGR01509 family)